MTAGALSNGDADPEFWLTTRFWRQYGRLKVIFSNCNSITARVSVATASGTTPAFIALHADNHLVAFARDGEPDASVSETFELSADGEVDLSLIGYRRVADDDFATEVPSYGVAIKCDNQASFTSLLHAQTGSHWQWVDASEPRECTRADTSVVMNYAVGSGDSWQRTGAMVEVSTAECVSPRAAIADARLDAAKRAIFTRPASENWSALPYDSTNERIAARLLIAGRALRFGSACVRVGGTSSSTGLDTLKAESCTPSGASLSLVYRTVSGGATIDYPVESPVDDSSSPTPYPIDRVYQTPGEGHYTTLLGVGPNGAGDKYQGHCVRMVASPWAFAENGLNKGTPQHWGARNVIGSTKSLSYAGAEPTVHASLLGTDYVQINAGGTSADTYVCPLAEQAQVLLHKVVTVCDSDQDCYCKTTGDPHHFSYDGLKEDYMAVGYHRITGAGSRFELNTFQDSMTTEGRVSFNRLLYLKVDGEDVFSTQVHREDHDWCLTFWAGSQKTGDTSATSTDAQGFLTEAAGVDGLAMMPSDGDAPWTHTTSEGNTVSLKALVQSDEPFGSVAHAGWRVDVPAYGLRVAFKFNTWRNNPHWDVYIELERAHANAYDLGGFCGNCDCDKSNDFTFKSSPDDIPPEYQCKTDCRRSDDDTPTGPPPPPTPLCEGEPISMNALIHDFARCHPDFEDKIGSQKDLVNFELENWIEDRPDDYFPVPSLRNGNVYGVQKGHYKSWESFKSWWGWHRQATAAQEESGSQSSNLNSWFGSTDPKCYDSIDQTVQLAGSKQADNVCCFEHGDWFPMDQFGNAPSPATYGYEGQSHNFWFTMEVRNTFTYTGDETFKFCGDDDVYVFINKRRFVDLGGVHSQECTGWKHLSDSAEDLGLELGGTYSFDFFFAERHTTQSNFKLTTSCFLEQQETPQCDRMTDEAAHECCKHLIAPIDATAEADRTLNVPYKRCVIETKASCECNTQQQCEDEYLENLFAGRVPTPCVAGTAESPRAFMGTELAMLGGWTCSEHGGVSIPEGWAIARDSQALRAALPSRCDMGDKCLALSSAFAGADKGHSVSFDARGRDCDSSHAIIEDGDCYQYTPKCFRPRSCDAELLLVRTNSDATMDDINTVIPYALDWVHVSGSRVATQALEAHDSPTFAAHLAIDIAAGNEYVSHSVEIEASQSASRMSCAVWVRQDPAALELAAGSDEDHVLGPTADAKAGGLFVVGSFHESSAPTPHSLHYGITARRDWLLATVDVPVPSTGAAGTLSLAIVGQATKIKHQAVVLNCSATPRFFTPNYVQGDSAALSHNRVRNPSFDASEVETTWLRFESGDTSSLTASHLEWADSSASAFGAMGMSLDDGTHHARLDAATSSSSGKVVGVQQAIQFDGNVDGGSKVYTVRAELDTKTSSFFGLCDLAVTDGPTGIPRDVAEQAAVVYMDVHFNSYPNTGSKSLYGETLSLSVCDSSRWTHQSVRWSSPYGTSESIKWVTFTVMLRNSWSETKVRNSMSMLVDNVYVVGTDCDDDTPTVPGVTSGDPHTLTMDGFMYDFHAPGDYLLMTDKFLTVYARHELPFSGVGSINTAMHLRFVSATGSAGHLVEVYAHEAGGDNEPRLFIDGVLQPSLTGSTTHTTMRFGSGALVVDIDGSMVGDDPTRALRRFSIAYGAHACTVVVSKSQSGVQLIDIVPQLPSSSATLVQGLLGNFDGDALNDIRMLGATTPIAELCNDAERAAGEETMRTEAIVADEIKYVSNCPFHTSSTFRPPQAALLRSGFASSYNVTGHANVFPSAYHAVDVSVMPGEASFDDATLLAQCNERCSEHSYVTFDQFRNCVADCVMTGGDLLPRRITVPGSSPTEGYSAEEWQYWTHVRTKIDGDDDSSSSTTLTIVIVTIVAVVIVFIAVLAFVLLRRSRAATKLETTHASTSSVPESHPLSPRDVETAGYTSEKGDSI